MGVTKIHMAMSKIETGNGESLKWAHFHPSYTVIFFGSRYRDNPNGTVEFFGSRYRDNPNGKFSDSVQILSPKGTTITLVTLYGTG